MIKQVTPQARLNMVSRLRWRLNFRAAIASLPIDRNRTIFYLSSRSASTGVSPAARDAGRRDETIAISPRAPNEKNVVVIVPGTPENISAISPSFKNEKTPKQRPHQIEPLTTASN